MSPAHAKTSDEEILDAAASLLESGGLDALTMQEVARIVGVRAPSLYKRVRDRAALIRAVQEDALAELAVELDRVVTGTDGRRDIVAMLNAFRGFAHRRAGVYGLLFAALPKEVQISSEANRAAIEPLFRVLTPLAGGDPERTLEAARLLVAFAHGFVSMELAGAFRLGGDVDAAWRAGVATIVDAVAGVRH
jgi:AcrR family transcriptional regulator